MLRKSHALAFAVILIIYSVLNIVSDNKLTDSGSVLDKAGVRIEPKIGGESIPLSVEELSKPNADETIEDLESSQIDESESSDEPTTDELKADDLSTSPEETDESKEDESETDGGNKEDGSEAEDSETEDESNPAEEIDGTEEGETKTEIETDATETDVNETDATETNESETDETITDKENNEDGSETEDPEIEDKSNPAEETDETEESETKTEIEIETDSTETDETETDETETEKTETDETETDETETDENETDATETNASETDETITEEENNEDGSVTEDPEIEDKSNPAEETDETEDEDESTSEAEAEGKTEDADVDPFKEPRPHPHAGARYPDGKFGYVADVTSVRKRHLELYSDEEYKIPDDLDEFEYFCEKPPGEGWEGVEGLKLMTEKVEIGGPTPLPDGEETKDENVTADPPKVLCMLYTYDKNHDRVEAVANTWGWKCDGFLAFSTLTNETIGSVDLPHFGEEAYNNMWQKTRSIWAYVHDNYLDDYDYFWLGGDDFYLIVENLVNYLASIHKPDSEDPLLLGHQIPKGNTNFCGGGPGYVLNKMAVKKLIKEALPTCYPETIVSAEDRYLSICFQSIGVQCTSTADAKGQQRFLGMDPNFMATYKGDRGYFKAVWEYWGQNTGRFKWGKDLVSEQMNGWHNLRYPAFMIRIHTIHHPESCPADSTVATAMAELMDKKENEE